ncbi:MAG: response regulator [Anaerolineae bacterium]
MLKNKTIFIVEDDAFNLAIIRTLLRHQGAIVPFDHWGDNTITRIQKYSTKIDMILLDLMLYDGISGHDIFKLIKEQPALSDIPVVAVSAADPGIEIPKTQAAGFNGFISKPIKPQIFPKQIVALLNGKEIWGG